MRLEILNLCHNMIKELPPDITSMRCKFFSCIYALIISIKSNLYFVMFTLFYSIIIIIFSGSIKNVGRQFQPVGDVTSIR